MSQVETLVKAIQSGTIDDIVRLVDEDPAIARARNAEGISMLLLAAYTNQPAALAALLPRARPLDVFEAATVGDTERVIELTEADPSLASAFASDGFYPLGLAAFFGNAETVGVLLARGADVHAVAANPMRVQALHAACAARRADIVDALLAAGADPNACQQAGFTPLHAAAQHGDEVMARLLLDAGADPAVTTDDGKSPADLAAASGHDAMVALLADR